MHSEIKSRYVGCLSVLALLWKLNLRALQLCSYLFVSFVSCVVQLNARLEVQNGAVGLPGTALQNSSVSEDVSSRVMRRGQGNLSK